MSKPIQTVVLIDDDDIDNFIHRRVLRKSGLVANIESFVHASDALDYLQRSDREQVDVIFLDINMPLMSGFEFLDAYEQLPERCRSKVTLMLLTTSSSPADYSRAKQYKTVAEYSNKPLSQALIEDIVAKYFPLGDGRQVA